MGLSRFGSEMMRALKFLPMRMRSSIVISKILWLAKGLGMDAISGRYLG